MFAEMTLRRAAAAPRATQHYGTVVIVGGGCYGAYYVRQLRRAAAAGALTAERLLVVDRDPACRVAAESAGAGRAGAPPEDNGTAREPRDPHRMPTVRIVVAHWEEFFDRYLGSAAETLSDAANDAIVPSPLMPHLMFDWLVSRARGRWPGREVRIAPIGREPSVPWQRSSGDGTHYVSFAEWMCPINCVEPASCPAIGGPRTWSLPAAVRAYVASERERGRALAGPIIFHCRHRAYGVGMFDTADVLSADRLVAEAAADGPAELLVGTVSHCHGALSVLSVGAPAVVLPMPPREAH